MRVRCWFILGAMIAAPGIGNAGLSNRADTLRQIAASVGHVIGAASACREISQSRIRAMTDKLSELITSPITGNEEFSSIRQAFDQSVAEGRRAVTSKQTDCVSADRDLADMEGIVTSPASAATTTGAPPAKAATVTPRPLTSTVGEVSPRRWR
jgi:hypothetical protein